MKRKVSADVWAMVDGLLASGEYVSEAEVLRKALAALYREADLAAIREGIAAMEAGRYRPFEEFDAEMRNKYGFLNE